MKDSILTIWNGSPREFPGANCVSRGSLLREVVKKRVLVLDGAMGTMIQNYHLKEEDFRGSFFKEVDRPLTGRMDLLSLTRPDMIEEIHQKYLEAGADIIETNTFNASTVAMAEYGLDGYCREVNVQAVRLARKVADVYASQTPDMPRWVAGAVGPTAKMCSRCLEGTGRGSREWIFQQLYEGYRVQMEALLEGGVDAFLIETITDLQNAEAALLAAEQAMKTMNRTVPLMLSVTLSKEDGRLISGETLDDFLALANRFDVFSVGINCSYGARHILPYLRNLAQHASYYITAYPNAGLPDRYGRYEQTPKQFAEEVKAYLDEGLVAIVGGCCGTNEEYIEAVSRLVK